MGHEHGPKASIGIASQSSDMPVRKPQDRDLGCDRQHVLDGFVERRGLAVSCSNP